MPSQQNKSYPERPHRPTEKTSKNLTPQSALSKSRDPVIGFGDSLPAFMKNYFPNVPAGIVKKI